MTRGIEQVPTFEIGHGLRSHSITRDDLVHDRYLIQGYVVHITTRHACSIRLRLRDKQDADGRRESGNQVIAQGKEKSRFSSSIPCEVFISRI